MTSNQIRRIASSFSDFKGFRIVSYTHRLAVITGDAKRHVFLDENKFWQFAGDFVVNLILTK